MLGDIKPGDIVFYATGTVPWRVVEVIKLRQGRRLVEIDLGWRGRPRIEDAVNLFNESVWYRRVTA